MSETRTDEEKAQMYSAMLGSVSVITNALDSSNDFCSDMTAEEVKDRVDRVKEEITDVKKAVKEVANQAGDVVEAAKGNKRRGRPKKKK